MLLMLAAAAAATFASAGAAPANCTRPRATSLPAAAAEHLARYRAAAAASEMADARRARNAMRSLGRIRPASTRFCGLTYPAGPAGADCAPADTTLQGAAFLRSCCAPSSPASARCRPPAHPAAAPAAAGLCPCSSR